MDPQGVRLTVLGFEALVTLLLAVVYRALWRKQKQPHLLTWSAAWGLYAVRIACISAYLVSPRLGWLVAHQLATGGTALLLLGAALQFSTHERWPVRPARAAVVAVLWVLISLYGVSNFAVGGLASAVVLSTVTLWTGFVFWRYRRRMPSTAATVLAVTFWLWGLHHLDYPLLRPLGSGVLYGALADVLFIVVAATATLFLALSEGSATLEARSAQLEQLTRLLLRAQEQERRRLARELHDEAGQILTAAKIELDREGGGRAEAAELVERALVQIRDLSHLLRPSELDDLGLMPALQSLVDDFANRYRIGARLEVPDALDHCPSELEVALYRVVQEALTNVARHSQARSVAVSIRTEPGQLLLSVADDGGGMATTPTPHLGLLGIRERIAALAGTLVITTAPGAGFRLDAVIPITNGAKPT